MATLRPLAIASLALLLERPMHPYEMYQTLLSRRQDRMVPVKPGTLYHAVERMERDGLVAAAGVEREGNRPERTVYAITDAGSEALRSAVESIIARPVYVVNEFPVAMGEAHHLPAERVTALLEERLIALREPHDELAEALEASRSRGVDERYLLAPSYHLHQLSAEIAWIEGVLSRIASGDLPWGASALRKESP